MKIGFIGIGLMGFPMAKNLLLKKIDLKVFSRTLEKAKPLEEFGAILTNSLSDVVEGVDIVITMLTDDNAVENVLGDKEFLANIEPLSTVIDMSSIKPKTAIKYGKLLKKKKLIF